MTTPRYERVNENEENQIPMNAVPSAPQQFYGDQQPPQQPYVASAEPQHAMPVAQPIHPQQIPPAYMPQQYVSVTPPVPNAAELEERILTRKVDFDSFRFIKEGWAFLRPNLCTFLFVMLTWLALFAFFTFATMSIESAACPRWSEQGCSSFFRRIMHSFLMMLFCVFLQIPFLSSAFFAIFQAMRSNSHLQIPHFFSAFTCAQYGRTLKLGFVMAVVQTIGYLLFYFPGLYFSLVTTFVIPLYREHDFLHVCKSIKYSWKIVHRYFCHFIGFSILLALLQVLGILAFGIGVFITLPLAITSIAYAYHHLIGVNNVPILVPRPMGQEYI